MPKFEVFREYDKSQLVYEDEYVLDGKRLKPWDEYPMPFSGAWCVVRPRTQSGSHTQIDQEIFIAIKGEATLVIGDERRPFKIGDTAVIPKHTDHYVDNDTDEDFEFYVLWWDVEHAEQYLSDVTEKTGCLDV